jgi:hypothetical protein
LANYWIFKPVGIVRMTNLKTYPPRSCTPEEIDLMVELNRQGWANREIAQELRISGRSVNAYLNQIRIRGAYPGGAPGPSPKPMNPLLSLAVELAPGFDWGGPLAFIGARRIEPADGAKFEFGCPLGVESFAQQVGEGVYDLWFVVGGLTLFRSRLHVSATYGPPRLPEKDRSP